MFIFTLISQKILIMSPPPPFFSYGKQCYLCGKVSSILHKVNLLFFMTSCRNSYKLFWRLKYFSQSYFLFLDRLLFFYGSLEKFEIILHYDLKSAIELFLVVYLAYIFEIVSYTTTSCCCSSSFPPTMKS